MLFCRMLYNEFNRLDRAIQLQNVVSDMLMEKMEREIAENDAAGRPELNNIHWSECPTAVRFNKSNSRSFRLRRRLINVARRELGLKLYRLSNEDLEEPIEPYPLP